MNIKSNLLSIFLKLVSVSIVVSAITLLSNFVVAKFASKEIYSDFVIYQSYYLIISNFLPLGITAAVVFFKDRCSDCQLFSIVSFYTVKALPVISLFLVFFFLCVKMFVWPHIKFNIIASIILASYSQACLNIMISFYQITEKFYLFQKVALLNVFLYSCSLFLSIFIFTDVFSLFLMYGFTSFILYHYNYKNIKKVHSISTIDKNLNKNIIYYAIPAALNSVVISFLITGDKVVIAKFIDDSSIIADYGYASFIASIFLFVVNNVATTIGVFLAQFKSNSPTLYEYCIKFKSFQFKNLLFIPIALAFTPLIFISKFFFNVLDFKIFYSIAAVTLLSYTIHGVTKLYLGFLNSFKKSFYILMSGTISCIIIYSIVDSFYSYLGLIGIPFSFFIGTLSYFVFLLTGSYLEIKKHE